jgi:hypothetical protein
MPASDIRPCGNVASNVNTTAWKLVIPCRNPFPLYELLDTPFHITGLSAGMRCWAGLWCTFTVVKSSEWMNYHLCQNTAWLAMVEQTLVDRDHQALSIC